MKKTIKNIRKLKKQGLLSEEAFDAMIERTEKRLEEDVAENETLISNLINKRKAKNQTVFFDEKEILKLISLT